jgi:hypothetical protein
LVAARMVHMGFKQRYRYFVKLRLTPQFL